MLSVKKLKSGSKSFDELESSRSCVSVSFLIARSCAQIKMSNIKINIKIERMMPQQISKALTSVFLSEQHNVIIGLSSPDVIHHHFSENDAKNSSICRHAIFDALAAVDV